MKRDSRLSVVLHVLIHMIAFDRPVTSEVIAAALTMNPVVVRRTLASLRDAGFVSSEKGHGGGWAITCDPEKTTLLHIYRALGTPELFTMTARSGSPNCLVEQAVNGALASAYKDASRVLLRRFEETTLVSLTRVFKKRYDEHRCFPRGIENV